MATVNGYTAEYMQDIVDATIVGGHLEPDGDLVLERHDGAEVPAGNVLVSFNLIYPVGSIYLSVNDVNPGTLFGGTWVAFGAGRMPIGVNAADSRFNVAQETGGTDTISAAMLPQHTHTLGGSSGADAAHTHGIGGSTGGESVDHSHGVSITSGTVSSDHQHGVTQLQKTANASGQSSDNGGGSVAQGTASGRFSAAGNQTASATGGINANHTHAVVGNTGGRSAGHTHTLPTDTGAGSSHSHSLPANTGNNAAQSATLLPPYIAVHMWRRTA